MKALSLFEPAAVPMFLFSFNESLASVEATFAKFVHNAAQVLNSVDLTQFAVEGPCLAGGGDMGASD